ncbi:efflux transporter outer membrane subunit [Capnocytophaga sp.]|uniref:efflux transporter outer membrane subunit n=1 Tax=Capnocytophaga sp. TaxID=44737 RepID=UPI0026DDB4E2|nr:efflux transporter outer membrane subunit [Capnocytophaga sp.]MDO5105529.1 efflux transporter outer membrane subunit [Capnocytophaga sp.]
MKKVLLITMGALLASCVARKPYERPQLPAENAFRSETISPDSLSSAVVSWKDIFTDSHLQTYINKALTNNLDIRVALQNINIAQSYLKQGKQGYLPTFSLNAGYTHSTASLNTATGRLQPERTFNNQWDAIATASWEADIWGKISTQNKANQATFLVSTVAHQAVKSQIVAALATAYYQLLMYDKQQQVLNQTISLREESLLTTQQLKQAGITTEVAVQQTEALLHNARAQLISVENNIWVLENSIAVLLGETPQKISRTTLEAQAFPTHFRQGYPLALLENRPDVRQAEANLMAAFELTNVARAGFYPSFTITERGGVGAENLADLLSPQSLLATIVGGLAQPIFNRRNIKTNYEVQQARQEIAVLQFQKSLLTASKEVADAMHQFSRQDEYINLKEKETEAYKKATDYSKELFNSGLASYLEVITAEVNRLNAELALAAAKFTRMQYGVSLYKALGGGWR